MKSNSRDYESSLIDFTENLNAKKNCKNQHSVFFKTIYSNSFLQKNWPEVQKSVFQYLGKLFDIGKDIFDHGQKAVQMNNTEKVAKVYELFNDESVIHKVLHLTLVALLSAPIKLSFDLIGKDSVTEFQLPSFGYRVSVAEFRLLNFGF